jgi:hypothetical protein
MQVCYLFVLMRGSINGRAADDDAERGVELSSAFRDSGLQGYGTLTGATGYAMEHVSVLVTLCSDGGIEFLDVIPHFVSTDSICKDWKCVIDKRSAWIRRGV